MELEEKSGFEAAGMEKNNCSAKVVKETLNPKGLDDFLTSSLSTDTHTNNGQAKPGRAIGMPQIPRINQDTIQERGALDFPPKNEDLKEFPLWGLPQELQDAIIDVAKGYKCSPTIPAVAMLATAAGAIGKGAESTIDNHHNYPSIWPIIVGTPSTSKSGPSSFFTDPLDEADEQAENAYNAELANWITGARGKSLNSIKELLALYQMKC